MFQKIPTRRRAASPSRIRWESRQEGRRKLAADRRAVRAAKRSWLDS